MLSDELKSSIQHNYSLILQRKQLQTRPGQKRMIAEIARTLAGVAMDEEGKRLDAEPGICVVEAGTGTGKTLAYLLAAIPVAQALDKKLVIATATVALQEQVLHKDIPDLLSNSELRFTYALAKGRGRYLCLSKLDNALRSNSSADAMRDLFAIDVREAGTHDQALYESMLESLAAGSWQGDRDDWPEVIEDSNWRTVAVEHGQCSGPRCSYFSTCCYFRNRNNLEKVDCVVANHDLVLSDLALGGGVILPAPEDSIYIFDEAHQLPAKGISHFSHVLKLGATGRWLEQLPVAGNRLLQVLQQKGSFPDLLEQVADLAHVARLKLQEVQLLLQQFAGQSEAMMMGSDSSQYVFPIGVVAQEAASAVDALGAECVALAGKIQRVNELLKNCMEQDGGELDRQQAESWFLLYGAAMTRVEAAAICCLQFSRPDEAGGIPHARWLVFREAGGESELSIAASPVMAAVDLQEKLWDHCFAAVLTSATLTALGSFDFLIRRCGLPEGSACHRIASPFNYQEAAVLRLPRKGFDPATVNEHTGAITRLLPELLQEKSGALVLFSSRRQLLDVLHGLDAGFRKQVLAQDDYSKQELLRLHREAVDRGNSSIIFGLAGLAEGIDLPGAYCRHVVIAKIPFPVPNDPVDATLGEWVKQQGRNPFREISVPEAALRLIQASGRLLRQESDSGCITILDERLLTRPYGKGILDSLPPYQREFF